ncbi:MAG: acetate/propionate family kinase, partial [Ruminococcus sp.]|nr:acetate/propionate family kinase [Ruminococcus sp.]
MIILVVNAGSSSLKYQLINMDDESVIAKGNCDRIGIDGHISHKTGDGRAFEADCNFPTHTEAFMKLVEALTSGDAKVIDSMDEISAVGHRIVQGADVFDKSVIVTDEIIDKIDELRELAPVHNHAHALALRACKNVIPEGVPQVAVFDTAFHQTMPPKAYMFGLPYDDYANLHVRKYGFHGTSHRFVSSALAEAMGKDIKDLKIVSCHLGNGSSITAVDGGKSVDTSMGFTPLDGVVMGTRTGSVDPSAVTYVADKHGFTPAEMSDYMNKKSGFLGVSGVGSDNRDITNAAEHGNDRAKLVSDM